jgi:phage gpG-like protein
MINIRLDMGKVPSVLAALSDPAMGVLAAKAAAEAYVDETLDWIKAGKGFTSRTGQLEQSIGWRPLADGAEVYANKEYAGFVEFGTDPHVIEPKPGRKALKFSSSSGGFAFARRVNHPGSRPHPFFFADRSQRNKAMEQRALSVLAARMAQA